MENCQDPKCVKDIRKISEKFEEQIDLLEKDFGKFLMNTQQRVDPKILEKAEEYQFYSCRLLMWKREYDFWNDNSMNFLMTLPTFFELQFLVLYVCKSGAIVVERSEAGTRPATQQAEHPSVRKKDQRPGEDYRHRRVWK